MKMKLASTTKCLLLLSYGTMVHSLLGPPCTSPLGLDYHTFDHHLTFDLTVSSGDPQSIRMNGPEAWSPQNISASFVEIHISQPVLLTALQVQGDPKFTGQITEWLLETSVDCESYTVEMYSIDQSSPVYTQTVYLRHLEFVSCLRLRPKDFKGKAPALRLELLGCVLQDTSTCDRDVHPTTEIWMDDGGRQLNFAHEIVLSWVKIFLELHEIGDSGDVGISYSRNCDKWDYYEPFDTTMIGVTSSDEKSSWVTIELDKPVRAKCLRIFPPLETILREVHTSGCGSHFMSGIRELKMNGKDSMTQDITAYQKDAPQDGHETNSESEDNKFIKDDKDKSTLSDTKIKKKLSQKQTEVTEDDVTVMKYTEQDTASTTGDESSSTLPTLASLPTEAITKNTDEAEIRQETKANTEQNQKQLPQKTETITLATILYNSEQLSKNISSTESDQDNSDRLTSFTAPEIVLPLHENNNEYNVSFENKTPTEIVTNNQQIVDDVSNKQQNSDDVPNNGHIANDVRTEEKNTDNVANKDMIKNVTNDEQVSNDVTTKKNLKDGTNTESLTDDVKNKEQIKDNGESKQKTDDIADKGQKTDDFTDTRQKTNDITDTEQIKDDIKGQIKDNLKNKEPVKDDVTDEEQVTDAETNEHENTHDLSNKETALNETLSNNVTSAAQKNVGENSTSDNYKPGDSNIDSELQVVNEEYSNTKQGNGQFLQSLDVETVNTEGLHSNTSSKQDGNQVECGVKASNPRLRRKRVISGRVNDAGEWPWLVSMHFLPEFNFTLRSGFKHTCGASLIAPGWILTAAHCFSDAMNPGLGNISEWRIFFGINDLAMEDNQDFVQERLIEAVYSYPEYTIETEPLIYDVALVKLNKPVEFTERVSPICLDGSDLYYKETKCFVTGWGQLTDSSPGSRYPHTAALTIMTPSSCKRKYDILPEDHPVKPYIRIQPPVLCATVGTNGEDACQGDSGGPLMCENNGRWYQAGIVAAGYLCGHEATPGLYTRVSFFADWIRDTMELNADS